MTPDQIPEFSYSPFFIAPRIVVCRFQAESTNDLIVAEIEAGGRLEPGCRLAHPELSYEELIEGGCRVGSEGK
jgi:hypothetical protein